MKKVMVRAWEIAREGAKKFGGKAIDYLAEALRMAWAEFKMAVANERGSVKLVGTEKQVKWANDIRDKYMKAFDEMYELFKDSKQGKKTEDLGETKEVVMNAIFGETDSKYYIEKLRFVKEYDETQMGFFLKEQLKDLIEDRNMGAIRFYRFFAGKYITRPTIFEIFKKHGADF